MLQSIISTGDHWAGLLLRLTAGLILLPHGAQKVFGMFGGYGFNATMLWFTGEKNFPWLVGFGVIVIELVGSLMLIAGIGTRLWAFSMVVLMIGIILTSHLGNGFFMNWDNNQTGEGFEYHLLFIGICITLLFIGGGKYSIDNLLSR